MRRDLVFTWVLSFLLIGMGFLLGYAYAGNGGFLHQEKIVFWAAPSPITETGDRLSLLMGGILTDAPWKQENVGSNLHFPARVGALHMDKLISGTEALGHAWRIHGHDAPFDRVFIPYYSSRDEQVTVWVFEIHSTHEAVRHLKKINDRITVTREPDSYSSFFLQNVQVFHLQTGSENSYYYRKGNNIYWISLITNDPIPLFLRFYKHF